MIFIPYGRKEEAMSALPAYGVRFVSVGLTPTPIPCCRCADANRHWDRIAGKTYCPTCLELLALGEADPVVERAHPNRCLVCHHNRTLRYITHPLGGRPPIEFDLCPEHLRAFIARRLSPHAFEQMRRTIHRVQLEPHDVFLLHEQFYDSRGHALHPMP